MTELEVRTESLGGSALARAASAGETPTGWYEPRPHTPSAWSARAERTRRDFASGAWLDALTPALQAGDVAAARLARVRSGGGVVVTTGQQPGLFGGPIYTWSKAIAARAMADEIERATGVPAAPVFWAASDDADFAEASWTAVAMPGGAKRVSIVPTRPPGPPLAEIPLGDVSAALDTLARACGSTIDPRPLAAVRAAYRDGATIGSAYVALLRELLHPLGIAVLDAAHPSVVEAMRPTVTLALTRASAVAEAVRERADAIVGAGYEAQVAEVAGLSLVFDRRGGEKRRIPLAEAATIATSAGSTTLSPNVLLRPVVERALMPTVVYMAGPGEIAYFAQSSAVAQTLELAAPLAVPRWSGTIIEPHVARILDQLGLTADDLADPHAVEGRLARAAVPAPVRESVESLRRDLESGVASVGAALREAGALASPQVVDGVRRAVQMRIDRLERRIVAATKRREAETMRRIATARGALYPLGVRQERALNAIPLFARHGAVIVNRMLDGARAHARALVGGEGATDAAAGLRERGVAHAASPDAVA